MTVRIGLVGYGYWGLKVARTIHSIPEAELVSIADVDRTRLELACKDYPHVKPFSSHVDLLVDDDVDGIWVATPASSHFTVTAEALAHGKHVLVEKPMASNSEEALKMTEMAGELDLVLMAGHTYLYDPTIRILRRLVTEGRVGRVLYIESHRTGYGIFREDVDVIWDLAPHDVSIFRYLLGTDPISVCAWGNACLRPPNTDVACLSFRFPQEIRTVVHVSWLEAAKRRQITIVGTKGMALFNNVGSNRSIRLYQADLDMLTSASTANLLHDRDAHTEMRDCPVPPSDSLVAECAHFVHCIQEQTPPLSTGYDGLCVVRALEAASNSLLNNGRETRMVEGGAT